MNYKVSVKDKVYRYTFTIHTLVRNCAPLACLHFAPFSVNFVKYTVLMIEFPWLLLFWWSNKYTHTNTYAFYTLLCILRLTRTYVEYTYKISKYILYINVQLWTIFSIFRWSKRWYLFYVVWKGCQIHGKRDWIICGNCALIPEVIFNNYSIFPFLIIARLSCAICLSCV